MLNSSQKFLFDENIGLAPVEFFRGQGFDIKSAIEDLRGEKDREILKIAYAEQRIIVTLDKDFCYLIFKYFLPCRGVILLRLSNESQKNIIYFLGNLLKIIGNDLQRNFIVVKDENIRIRKIK